MKEKSNYSNPYKEIRAAQIVLGAITIILSTTIIADPALGMGYWFFFFQLQYCLQE